MAQLWPPAIFFSLLTLLILAGTVYGFVEASKKYYDLSDILLFLLVPGVILLFTGSFAICTVSELAGWMTSPQGMVISMFLDKIGG